MNPTAFVLAAPGTNRDHDVSLALKMAGADPRVVLLDELLHRPSMLAGAQMLVVAGGFSYADSLGAGRMFALRLMHGAGDEVRAFIAAGKPVLGICNGFQVLTGAGLLPGALAHNDSGQFQCRWVTLDAPASTCVWTQGLDDLVAIEAIDCPIAHGEGRYVHPDLDALRRAGQVALTYRSNPNGSAGDIAGVCDPTGLVMGLMPHPENHVIARQHPNGSGAPSGRLGLQIFERGVRRAAG